MASPYFTPIETKSPDLSGIARGGQAMGRAYESIGKALGVAASSYFEKKKVEGHAKRAASSKQGDLILLNAGMSQEDIDLLDGMQREKIINEAIKEAGGIQQFQKTQLMLEQNRLARDSHAQQMRINKVQADQAELVVQDTEDDKKTLSYALRKDADGNPAMNFLDLPDDPRTMASVARVSKQYGIAGFMQNNISSYIAKARQTGGLDLTDKSQLMALVNNYNASTGVSGEDAKRNQEIVTNMYVDPADIRKTATEYTAQDPSFKTAQNSVASTGALQVLFKENTNVKKDESGKIIDVEVTNPVGAAVLQRLMAKMANEGVLTDRDVLAITGETDIKATFERIYNKLIGTPEEYISSALTGEDIRFVYEVANQLNGYWSNYADEVSHSAIQSTATNYKGVPMGRIAEVSGYGKYLSRGSLEQMGLVEPESSVVAQPTAEQQKAMAQRVNGVRKLLEENGGDTQQVKEQLLEKNPNLKSEEVDKIIEQASNPDTNGVNNDAGLTPPPDEDPPVIDPETGKAHKALTKPQEELLQKELQVLVNREDRLTGSSYPFAAEIFDLYAEGETEVLLNGLTAVMAEKAITHHQLKSMSKASVAKIIAEAAAKTVPNAMGNTMAAALQLGVPKAQMNRIAANAKLSAAQKRKALEQAARKLLEKEAKEELGKNFLKRTMTGLLSPKKAIPIIGGLLLLNDVANISKMANGELTKEQIDFAVNERLANASAAEKPIIEQMRTALLEEFHERDDGRRIANSPSSKTLDAKYLDKARTAQGFRDQYALSGDAKALKFAESYEQGLMAEMKRDRDKERDKVNNAALKKPANVISRNTYLSDAEKKKFKKALSQGMPTWWATEKRMMSMKDADAGGGFKEEAEDIKTAYAAWMKSKKK